MRSWFVRSFAISGLLAPLVTSPAPAQQSPSQPQDGAATSMAGERSGSYPTSATSKSATEAELNQSPENCRDILTQATDRTNSMRRRYRELIASNPLLFANQPGGFEILLNDAEMDRTELKACEEFFKQRAENKALAEATPSASPEWFRVGVVFEDAYLTIMRDAVRTPTDQLITYLRIYNRLDKGPGTAILARFDGKIILLRHHRHALRAFLDEMPRGFSRPHESPEETARRQLREELGAEAYNIVMLGEINPDGGKLGDVVFGVLADVSNIKNIEHGEAIISYELVDEKELTRRIANGEITDAFTLSLYAQAVARKLISAQ